MLVMNKWLICSFMIFITQLSMASKSHCYWDMGKIHGENIDQKLRIASLTKLYTSYYALKELGAKYQYKTTFTYTDEGVLYIKGGKDPYFLEHGLFYFISELSKMNIVSLKKVIFDSDFYFHFKEDQKIITKKLLLYFNSKRWKEKTRGNSLSIREQYIDVKKLLKINRNIDLVNSPHISVSRVEFQNHFEIPNITGHIWTLSSAVLLKYLKMLNAYSNNITSDQIIRQLGGIDKFNEFIHTELGYNPHFYTGSGLNKFVNSSRVDNTASCKEVLLLMNALRQYMVARELHPADLLPVASKDVGTFKQRFENWPYRDSFVFKSGTLKEEPTSAVTAMHIHKLLNLVVLAQDEAPYAKLKSEELSTLNQIIKKLGIQPENMKYQEEDFIMFSALSHELKTKQNK